MSDQLTNTVSAPAPDKRPSNYMEVYANQIRMGVTQTDFSLIFGAIEDYGPGNMRNQDRVCVRVSPATMKYVVMTLQVALAAFEEVIGTVQMPDVLESLVAAQRTQIANGMRANLSEMERQRALLPT